MTIDWTLCKSYEEAKDFYGSIYLHMWENKPFYWGKAHNSFFGGSSRVSNEGAKMIAESLIQNQTLTTLYLSRNQIEWNGLQSILENIKYNYTITTLLVPNRKPGRFFNRRDVNREINTILERNKLWKEQSLYRSANLNIVGYGGVLLDRNT